MQMTTSAPARSAVLNERTRGWSSTAEPSEFHMPPSLDDFRATLREWFNYAAHNGASHVDLNSGDLHRGMGGYPPPAGKHHAMPSCCKAMYEEYNRGRAEILQKPPKGNGASLTIRYFLPRP